MADVFRAAGLPNLKLLPPSLTIEPRPVLATFALRDVAIQYSGFIPRRMQRPDPSRPP